MRYTGQGRPGSAYSALRRHEKAFRPLGDWKAAGCYKTGLNDGGKKALPFARSAKAKDLGNAVQAKLSAAAKGLQERMRRMFLGILRFSGNGRPFLFVNADKA